MDPTQDAPLLFVHTTGPTHVHRRDRKTKTKIRRHVMRELGESRRVAKRNPTIDLAPLTRPFWDQDPVAMLDQQWPMDVFSAYGLALLGAGCKKPIYSGMTASHMDTCSFWFPFAFTASGFLRHFSSFYTSPTLLQAVYHQSSAKAKLVALERSMGTISCVETSITSTDARFATRDDVIRAVLALICFNLLNLDHDQAATHAKGLNSVIAARGGIGNLENADLALMVFWVDVTLSLLFNTKPKYPVPWNHMPADIPARCRSSPPSQVPKISKEIVGAPVSSCIRELSLAAQDIESRWVEKGDAIWNDEMFLGFRLNPLAHALLSMPSQEPKDGYFLDHMAEMIRRGVLLWIIWVKQRSRSYPGSPMKYLTELLGFLHMDLGPNEDLVSQSSSNMLSLKLWLVAICGITSTPDSAERAVVIELMADTVRRLGVRDLSEAKTRLGQSPWISAFNQAYAGIWSQLR